MAELVAVLRADWPKRSCPCSFWARRQEEPAGASELNAIGVSSIAVRLGLINFKILVREDVQGKVWVSYNSPEYLQERHDWRLMLPNSDRPTPVKLPGCFLSLDHAPFAI